MQLGAWESTADFICTGKKARRVKNQLALQEKEAALMELLSGAMRVGCGRKTWTIGVLQGFSKLNDHKMIESLEQHCSMSLTKNRMAMFPRAGDLARTMMPRTGSRVTTFTVRWMKMVWNPLYHVLRWKMKTVRTATKKKNEHFFKEMDQQRKVAVCYSDTSWGW